MGENPGESISISDSKRERERERMRKREEVKKTKKDVGLNQRENLRT